MKIAGLQKTTLIDYPEKITAIIFTMACNFRCPYCHNKELVEPKSLPTGEAGKIKLIPEKEIFKFLEKRKGILDGVVITGGEPTLYKDLLEFIKKIKKLGYLVKIDTNGSNPQMLKNLIDNKLVDYIAMDIKGPLDKYEKIVRARVNKDNIAKSVEIIKNISANQYSNQRKSVRRYATDYEFRTTVVPGLLDKKDFEKVGEWLKNAKKYYLQQFRNTSTLVKSYEKVKPYSTDKLLEFYQVMKKYVKEVSIRGL